MYESRYEGKEFIMNNRHLSIPVILGTTRKGRMSAHAARFMVGMFTKLLGVSAGLILSVAGVAPGADNMPTKFTVRIENITKPDAFTATTGVKWSLGFSPGVVVVHADKGPIFNSEKSP